MAPFRRYHISVQFRVPLEFAYGWCTDYTPNDGKYAGESRTIHLQRRILSRGPRRVVFENLYDEGRGWGWERHTVTLHPPAAWHCVGKGSHQESVLDYELTSLSSHRTRLDMRWKSRPTRLAEGPRASVRSIERFVKELWVKRGRAMEREFRRGRSGG